MKKILKYLLYLVIAFVAFLVAMNIFVPFYIFDEPVPWTYTSIWRCHQRTK